MNMKRVFASALALALALCALTASAEPRVSPVGREMADFTVTDTEGNECNLGGMLAEKDLVVLNIFTTWCGPCRQEFPGMQAVYERLGDRMEIVAASAEPEDTPQALADYRAELGLGFHVGSALNVGVLGRIPVEGYPTTVFIDREGRIGYIRLGSFTSEAGFQRVCEAFLADDYDEIPAVYDVRVVDQYFNPVPGVYVNVCTDTTCMPIQTDEYGYITFAGKPETYHLQVLKAPEGYSFDPDAEVYTEADSDRLTLWIEAE